MLLWVSWLSEIKVMNPEFQFLPFLVRNIRTCSSLLGVNSVFLEDRCSAETQLFDVYTLQVLTSST